ncbi:sigma-70 family RNA polymerase sigma factor [Thalassotalea agariperforans]
MSANKASQYQSLLTQGTSNTLLAEQFLLLFEKDKNRLYSYIHAFVAESAAADDIFQETCLTLWKSFEKFEQGTNFSKWANSIAFRRVLAFRRQNKKYTLGLNDDFLTEFSEYLTECDVLTAQQEQKLNYLDHCRALLSAPLQQVYLNFYVHNQTAQEVAKSSGRSIHAIRKAVHKLRQQIFDCIDEKEQEDSL